MDDDTVPDDADWSDPDDVLAARIANAMLEHAREPGVRRLAAMQMAGLAGEVPTHGELGRAFGLPRAKVRQLERRALAFIAWKHPELRDELRAWMPGVVPRDGMQGFAEGAA